jgi:hypothetical protein
MSGTAKVLFLLSMVIKLLHMKFLIIPLLAFCIHSQAQQGPARPCATDTMYRQFDFWIGDWEVFGAKGKAGDSKIERLLDSCVILENWTSARQGYSGKSFNTYNRSTRQWQQTWVDNSGGSTEYLRGWPEKDKMIFYADKNTGQGGKNFLRRLTFHKLSDDKVRQHGERSDDDGKSWTTEYDLEYRRK